MGKQVELTWKTDSGKTVIEECILIDEDDKIYIKGDEEPVVINTDNGQITTVLELAKDRVMFEDDEGIFALHPNQVVNIKIL